jgi:hypothetical protein
MAPASALVSYERRGAAKAAVHRCEPRYGPA